MATADPGVGSWTPINIFAMIRALVNNGCPIVSNAGAPTSGTSGTFAGVAGSGTVLIDYTNKNLYMNTNTLLSPTWSIVAQFSAITGDVTISSAGVSAIGANKVLSSMLAANVLQVATGQITAANITGTSAGQLGHANGVVLVPAAPAKSVNILISAMIAMDFSVAAYTAGGNTTINISGGGSALTGLVNTTTFIQSAADVAINLVPLAATNLSYGTGANGLALVTSVAPTNPGTAAGVINWQVTYQTIPSIFA